MVVLHKIAILSVYRESLSYSTDEGRGMNEEKTLM
jgi:hypothetical protein